MGLKFPSQCKFSFGLVCFKKTKKQLRNQNIVGSDNDGDNGDKDGAVGCGKGGSGDSSMKDNGGVMDTVV